MMRNVQAMAAILAALFLGAVAATLLTGCQPKKPKVSSPTTTGGTTSGPSITIPKTEIKDEAPPADKPADVKAADEKSAEEKPAVPASEAPAETKGDAAKSEEPKSTEPKVDEAKPSEPKADAASTSPPAPSAVASDLSVGEKPAAGKPSTAAAALKAPTSNPEVEAGNWNQWGGTTLRNNTPVAANIASEWAPGEFDRKTGKWQSESAKNIKWVATLGSQTYGNTVVAAGKVWLGTNNSNGYLKRYPGDIDLGALVCFDEANGKFLWQHSSEKLPTGRVHDWPLQGICCSPLVEGDRLWFVTSRGEVRCLDTEGFYDGEDDGRLEKVEPARLFDIRRADEGAEDKVAGYVAELDGGKIPADVRARFEQAGMPLPAGDIELKADDKAKAPSKRWTFQAPSHGAKRDFLISLVGPNLSAFKLITPDDKEEADVIWVLNMMDELGISQHNMCSCSVTSWGDILFVNTSNGVDEAHNIIPAPDAPSFMAMNKHTGEILWTDNSPGKNILHGQWSSPTVAVLGGVPQVIFGGGDGWVYSFKAAAKKELLWRFDINEKDSILELGGRGTRNDIISTPVVYDNKVYFCTGQDPEHGEGDGTLWCIDPTKRGDISEKLAVNRADPSKPIPVKRVQAVVEADGDLAIDNPNSGVVWKFSGYDANGDGQIKGFEEKFHRSISTVVIKDDLLFTPDFSGQFYCVDAQTGKAYWTYDMLAAAWGSSMIAGDKVYVGDEDGDIAIFNVTKEKHDPLAEINMGNSVYSTPIVANNVLYIANKDHIFAITPEAGESPKASSETKAGGE